MPANADDDLLMFKDFSNSPSMNSPPPAQISVNSPTNSVATGTAHGRGDTFNDFVYNMSSSAQTFANRGNMNTDDDGGGSSSGALKDKISDAIDEGAINKVSFLTLEYYQQFFQVDTFMVIERIVNSIIPKRAGADYLRENIGKNPDLYGPVWINVTLIFSIAISGNIASYLQHSSENFHWHYNFRLVSYAATCIFLYVNLVPLTLWALLKYSLKPAEEGFETSNATYTPSLLSLMCVYGYSLSIYIPVSILWVIQFSLLQWLLVITAALLSGSVLIFVLTPALRNSKSSLFLIIGILGAHFLLAAGFMLYFFHVPTGTVTATTVLHLATPASIKEQVIKVVVGNIPNVSIPNLKHL